MGGSDGGNDEIIEHQKKEAKKAEILERERQNVLQSGRDRIMAMFSEGGGNYMTPEKYETTKVTKQVPVGGSYGGSYGGSSYSGGNTGISPSAGSEGYGYDPGYMGYGAQYGMGNQRTTNYAGGGSGNSAQQYKTVTEKKKDWVPGEEKSVSGIGQDFYDGFKNSILDYYNPEVNRQFKEAQEANLFDLARRGMLRSSVAADHAAEAVRERADAESRVGANAEQQTAGLRGDIANAQQSALSLLQQTEDPTAAANAAATEVNAIQSQAPNFDPLGDLFSAAARSFAGFQQAQNTKNAYQKALGGNSPWGSSGRNIG